MNQKTLTNTAWFVFGISMLLAIVSWGTGINWRIGSITAYQWFPLFGLLAWMTMWGHYVIGVLRIKNSGLKKPRLYGKTTAFVALGSFLLHPGILALQQFKNDQGLPPQSYVNFVGEGLKVAVMLGVVSLIIFLSFEFFNRVKSNSTVKKYWWAVSISQSLAMIAIFVHGLRLGTNLGEGWFRIVWLAYGLALIPCFYIIHRADFTKKES